ncbi:DUF6262 family protein [Nonomuraea sp. M3C6]|uniref:DUF6262 family protein n=1 Tax=Nonomuraea marmarensis TaxID=3351344 RepID=A0ABW7A9S7_9ACTN
MPTDNSVHLIEAARRRRELTRSKAVQALRELQRDGTSVTFEVVAHAAGVSRSWLYNQPDLRAEIQRLRELTRSSGQPTIPPGQRATDASLRQRLDETTARLQELRQENERLRRQLAAALGEQRAERLAPRRRGSTTIGPC